MSKILAKLFGNAGGSVVEKISGVVDKFVRTKDEKAAFEKISKVRSFFDFNEIGINPGEEIEFVRDSTIKATVYDDSTINFNGKITSLSAAAGEILNKDKDVKSRYNGVLYWSYKGQTLYELRKNKRRE